MSKSIKLLILSFLVSTITYAGVDGIIIDFKYKLNYRQVNNNCVFNTKAKWITSQYENKNPGKSSMDFQIPIKHPQYDTVYLSLSLADNLPYYNHNYKDH